MIIIATPARDTVNSGFAYDLAQLIKKSPEATFILSQGTLLCTQRTTLVKISLKEKATHILFIDSDMRFPIDTLERLLKHDLDIVGANCVYRGSPEKTTAWKGDDRVVSKGKTGLEEVDQLGLGVTLIKKEVFEKIAEPWFATPYDGKDFIGEDIFFSRKSLEHGFKTWVDHDLSLDVRHEGIKEWQH